MGTNILWAPECYQTSGPSWKEQFSSSSSSSPSSGAEPSTLLGPEPNPWLIPEIAHSAPVELWWTSRLMMSQDSWCWNKQRRTVSNLKRENLLCTWWMICVYAMHSRVRKFKFVVDKKEHTLSLRKLLFNTSKPPGQKYKNQINPRICYASSLELYKCWDSSPHATGGWAPRLSFH